MDKEEEEKIAKLSRKSAQKVMHVLAQEKKELLHMSEISIMLDNYDDIFSDFDPRPFSERALSDDFLFEAKKAVKDKPSGAIELRFLIPAHERDLKEESLIKKRLKNHFKKHAEISQKERKKTIKHGLLFVVSGIILMFLATLILAKNTESSFLTSFLIILLEPGGWFLFWEGLNVAIFESRKIKPEADFYERISKCEISFLSY